MRIRKNRKLSSFMPTEMIQAYDCQLNQSPWDVISFSEGTETDKSSTHHFERENKSKEDRSLGNFIGANIGSDTSLIEKPEKVVINVEDISLKNRDDNMDSQSELKEAEKIMSCIKNDGIGWKRRNGPAEALYDYHFGSLQSHNDKTNTRQNDHLVMKASEKMETTSAISARRGRSRTLKKVSTSTSNQYEFYYYSGFGPFWGKIENTSGNNNKVDGDDADGNQKSNDNDKAEAEINDNENENSCKKRKKSAIASIYNVKGW